MVMKSIEKLIQINKHFTIRFEAGFLGSRNQVMTGIQYRVGL